jgi:hypothetical protein|tara:strand:- start:1258 stop:1497 length:240 start_codon:yes stop_codon:yes gene_type:complete
MLGNGGLKWVLNCWQENEELGSMRTGVFWDQSRQQVLVYWRGQLVVQYPSMAAFVAAHLELVNALDERQQQLLLAEYQP